MRWVNSEDEVLAHRVRALIRLQENTCHFFIWGTWGNITCLWTRKLLTNINFPVFQSKHAGFQISRVVFRCWLCIWSWLKHFVIEGKRGWWNTQNLWGSSRMLQRYWLLTEVQETLQWCRCQQIVGGLVRKLLWVWTMLGGLCVALWQHPVVQHLETVTL